MKIFNHQNLFLLLLTSLILLIGFPPNSVQAKTTISVEDVAVFYEYGGQATFQALITSDVPIKIVYISIQSIGQGTRLIELTPGSQGEVLVQVDIQKLALRPFAPVDYWFEVVPEQGDHLISQKYQFDYIDNRFEWNTLKSDSIQIHWLGDDRNCGQDIFNVSEQALETVPSLIQAVPPVPLIIYVYRNPGDLQTALSLIHQSWVAGHASPDLGTILLSVPETPSQRLDLERQIPHELIHILLYKETGTSYPQIPAWLNEGMASMAELYPNPDYPRAMEKAIQANGLLSMNQLCSTFPPDASNAFLAYAQSASFMDYLYNKFGSPGINRLINVYKNGLGCEEGFKTALGFSLSDLETQWKQESLGMDMAGLAWRNLGPYIFLALIILIPAFLVGAFFLRKS